jgi:tetraacyldisaccharide 4'-kinase
VRPDVNILLTDFNRPFYRDYLLPMGNLREMRHHAGRADAVIVTKCPQGLEKSKMDDIERKVKRHAHNNIPVYFTYIKYLELKPVFNGETRRINKVFVFSGIAATVPFLNYMDKKYQMAGHTTFPDHFEFTEEVIRKKILKPYAELHDPEVAMVCTEKDAVRFMGDPDKTGLMKESPLYYLPVEVSFLRGEKEFLSMIFKTIEDTRTNKSSSD